MGRASSIGSNLNPRGQPANKPKPVPTNNTPPTSTATKTPTGWYDSRTNTYYDDPTKTPVPGSKESQDLARASMSGGSTVNSTTQSTPSTPTPTKSTVPAPNLQVGSSWNGTFSQKQVGMLMSKFSSKEVALKEITMNALAKGKTPTEAKAIAAAFNKALGFSTQNKPSSSKGEGENIPQPIVPPKTGIESVDNTISREEENRKKQEEFILGIKNESLALIDETKAGEAERAKNTEAILKQREGEANATFTRISALIKELESNANNALDLNTIQAINERNRQLAAKGLLTAAQAGGASAMMTEQFRQEAEKKRLDIMKTVTEAMMGAEKERSNLIDSIRQDSILNETAKQQGIERINGLYTNVIGNYSNQWLSANQQIDARIGSLLDVKGQMDADIMLEKAKKELEVEFSEQDRERVAKDPEARLDYIMEKLAGIDANMAREGAILLQAYIQDGRFNTMSTIELLAEVQRQAAINAKAYEKSGASSGGGGGGGTYKPPYQPDGNQPAGEEKVPGTNLTMKEIEALSKLPDEEIMELDPAVALAVANYKTANNLTPVVTNQQNLNNAYQQAAIDSGIVNTPDQQTLLSKIQQYISNNPYTVGGAVAGSIVPVFGTVAGGLAGAGIDYLRK